MQISLYLIIVMLAMGCDDKTVQPAPFVLNDAGQASGNSGLTDATVLSPDQGPISDARVAVDMAPTPVVQAYDFESAAPWFECPLAPFEEDAVEVVVFDSADQYFNPDNLRDISTDIEFPTGNWSQIGMWVELTCPENGLCDHWDRSASIQLQLASQETSSPASQLELARYITPYRKPMCQFIDVTELATVLNGTQTIHSWIDTWVGPGHAQGEGWRISVKFIFFPASQTSPPDVINIWGRRSITVGQIETELSVPSQTEPVEFMLPQSYSKVVAHLTTTGHSFGNTGNCAEFCQMRQDLLVNASTYSINPWRADCDQNPVTAQLGTWTYPRNGWCPGAISVGHRIDITDQVNPGLNTVDFDILMASGAIYENLTPVDLLPHEWVSLKLYVTR